MHSTCFFCSKDAVCFTRSCGHNEDADVTQWLVNIRQTDRNQVSTGWTFVSVSLTNLQHSVRGERCFLLWNHVWSSEFCVDFKVIVAITHRQAAWQQLHQTRYCLKNNVNASHAFVYCHQKDVIILQNLSHIYFTTSNKCHIYKSFALLCWHKMESWTTTSFFIN